VVGAAVFENSGTPGGGMQVQIRGATSILGQGDPLYVIDGVIVSNASVQGGLTAITRSGGSTNSSQDQTVNRLADLNPNDVENIEVLKSAAATAIYGSRATNGVVVITTKRGKAGAPRYNITQRVGRAQATRLLGSRHFSSFDAGCGPTYSNADLATCEVGSVKPWLGGSTHADSIARANCTPTCQWYDWQGDVYGRTDPSFETVLSSSGGINNTRYYGSLNDRQTKGIEVNTGARRTSGRVNLDQTIGDKITVSGGVDVTRNFQQNGIGNNENSGLSPTYSLGYWPAIYNIRQIDPVTNRPISMWMGGGGSSAANPLEVLNAITNNEDTWRQQGNVRIGYSLLTTPMNTLQFTYIGGIDRFQFESNQYSPNYLQFEPADGFLGTAQVTNFDSKFFNQSFNGVWTFTPGRFRINSAQTSFGGTREAQTTNNYFVRTRGLTPTRQNVVTSATDIVIGPATQIQQFIDQSQYVNEQIIAFGERLSIAAGLRGDRGTVNGDREKYYLFPKYSASYRFAEPLSRFTSKIDEVKFRASFGRSGNRPNYGVRDVTISSGGVIAGAGSLVASTTVGNPDIQPEVMNELEGGIDAALFKGRVALEATHYERVIKDLLVTYPLAPSSGLNNKTINGGQMSTRGFEAGLTIVPISLRDLEWTFRSTYQTNRQMMDKLLVPAFAVPGSFGSSYGRNRIAVGVAPTMIWGNQRYSCINTTVNGALVVGTGSDGKPCHKLAVGETMTGATTRDSIVADANPAGYASFLNTVRYKMLTLTTQVDWRIGGYTSDMTNNLWDEGGNARDFDKVAPDGGALGDYRYGSFANGNISPYIQAGSYVKLREINLTMQAPKRWTDLARARDMRIAFQARNLGMSTKYWSFDPEFNNFGNSNFNRFIDLAPYPSNRQFFLSLDLTY
jgi:TonB-dependent SusC/RagA subfamily outer membrane receptor